jgi:hypothetical protein
MAGRPKEVTFTWHIETVGGKEGEAVREAQARAIRELRTRARHCGWLHPVKLWLLGQAVQLASSTDAVLTFRLSPSERC